MGTHVYTSESEPATPAAGEIIHWYDSQGFIPCWKNHLGEVLGRSENGSIAAQGPGFATDTYLTGSNILVPSFGFKAKATVILRASMSKTAAGLAAPILNLRFGTGVVGDTSRLTLTGPAQTAIADIACLNAMITCRVAGAACILQGTMWWDHRGTAASSTGGTGFANDGTGHVEGTSAAFDGQGSAIGGLNMGFSINGGTSAAWTVTQVRSEAKW